jgi:ribosomal protein S10
VNLNVVEDVSFTRQQLTNLDLPAGVDIEIKM